MQMNKLPFCTQTIVVYNAYWGADGYGKPKQLWQGTVITNAMFKHTHKASQLGAVTLLAGSYIAKCPNDDAYVAPAVWAAIDERAGAFTVQGGDVIALHGEVLEIPFGSSPAVQLTKKGISFFTAKTAQANVVVALPATSHFCWAEG